MAADDVVVTIVGGGPSGLAVAAYLTHLSIPYTILERDDCIAPLWLKYAYYRLHLHLPKYACDLPLLPMPANYPKYPSMDQFIAYLNDYVSHFGITPKLRRSVFAAEYDGGNWKVKTNNLEEYRSKFLVVASGETCDPAVPELEGLGSFTGDLLHSTAYRNGHKFSGKSVLVVGSGNSGMEISTDLADCGAKTSIVVRSPIIYGDLSKYGIQRPKEGPFAMKLKHNKYPIIEMGVVNKIKSGMIQVLPAITSKNGNVVSFENGKQYPFDAIIFATGFKTSIKQWLKGDESMLDDNGFAKPYLPNNWKGVTGLYCVGLGRKGFFGAAMESNKVAHDIKAQL